MVWKKFLMHGEPKILDNKVNVTVGQVAREHIETPKTGTADQRQIMAALELLGWEQQKQSWGKRYWLKPDNVISRHPATSAIGMDCPKASVIFAPQQTAKCARRRPLYGKSCYS